MVPGQPGAAAAAHMVPGQPPPPPAAAAAHMLPGQPGAAAVVGGQVPVAAGGLQGGGEVMYNGLIIEGLDDL
jgi:hypothetical protein